MNRDTGIRMQILLNMNKSVSLETTFVFLLFCCTYMSESHQPHWLGLSRVGSPVMPCIFAQFTFRTAADGSVRTHERGFDLWSDTKQTGSGTGTRPIGNIGGDPNPLPLQQQQHGGL